MKRLHLELMNYDFKYNFLVLEVYIIIPPGLVTTV